MATPTAKDRFEAYFAEKVWELIPAVYRDEDGQGTNPGVLRHVVEIIADHAAWLRRGIDDTWDVQTIDRCMNWAVPYLADLVATRLVSSLNTRGRRVDVAKTIYYRRRKGTLRVLEELIADITGWEGVVVEEMHRIARFTHSLDPDPKPRAGRFSGTAPGGFADLRDARVAKLGSGPFEEYHHYPDVRRVRGLDGRYAIPKLGFHLYRLRAVELREVRPVARAAGNGFFLDPSRRDVPLFQRRLREASYPWDRWRSAYEWELPMPMTCRLLNHAEYEITEAAIQQLLVPPDITAAEAADLRTRLGIRFKGEAALLGALSLLPSAATITAPPKFPAILRATLIEECGKTALLPSYAPPASSEPKSLVIESPAGTVIESDRVVGGNLSRWAGAAPGKRVIVDPERGRLLFLGGAPAASFQAMHLYGTPGAIGAGGFDRSTGLLAPTVPAITGGGAIASAAFDPGTAAAVGVTEVADHIPYTSVGNVLSIVRAQFQARNFKRPYISIAANWRLSSGVNVESELLLDGLWIGASGAFTVRLEGDFETVTLRYMTLDPGGLTGDGAAIPPVKLQVVGAVETLRIERSITGPLQLTNTGAVETLDISDSIIDATVAGGSAIAFGAATVKLRRVTVLGSLEANVLEASEALITGQATVTNTQNGCFRYSSAAPGSRVPKPYESHFLGDSARFFTTRRFGDPAYVQLSENAPAALRTGGEDGLEIGAWSSLKNPILVESLRAKVDEYSPFGMIPAVVFET